MLDVWKPEPGSFRDGGCGLPAMATRRLQSAANMQSFALIVVAHGSRTGAHLQHSFPRPCACSRW
eukprot:7074617-Prymnesium_polylepis.1